MKSGRAAGGMAALALSAAMAAPPPAPRPAHDAYWIEKASLFDAIGGTAAVVMVGDSLTDGGEWAELFPGIRVANRGIDGDTTDGILERMGGIVALQASRAFVMVGINDFTEAGRSVEAVYANYLRIVSALRKSGAQVYVQSTLMCNERKAVHRSCSATNTKIALLNRKLAAPGAGDFTFVDLNARLSGKEGLRDEFTQDGVHLNGKGYLQWKDAISPFVPAGQKP